MTFYQDRTQDKKVIALDNSCTKAVSSASPGPTPKRCEPQVFLATLGKVICCWKALDLGSLNLQFEHDWPKDKKITGAKLRGKTIVLPERLFFEENYSSFNFLDFQLGKILLD